MDHDSSRLDADSTPEKLGMLLNLVENQGRYDYKEP